MSEFRCPVPSQCVDGPLPHFHENDFSLPPGDYETRCCTCGRPYEYARTYGCRPDWCANAPAPITNAVWEEFKKDFGRLQLEVDDLRNKIRRLEWETF